MADELISRQALLAAFEAAEEDDIELYGVHISDCFPSERAAEIANKLPAVDAVEVVRCKDCRWGVESDFYKTYKCTIDAEYDENAGEYIGFVEWHKAEHFCSYGERREENANN